MKRDGLVHALLDFFRRGSSRDAAVEIRREGRVPGFTRFDNDEVLHFLRPACLSTLFRVPGARSSFEWPATVTSPFLTGCLNWRWLPFVLTCCHPSDSRSLVTSHFPDLHAIRISGRRRDLASRTISSSAASASEMG